MVVTMPEFSGNTDELHELFYSFLEGVIEYQELRGYCERLMDSFGKLREVRSLLLLFASNPVIDAAYELV